MPVKLFRTLREIEESRQLAMIHGFLGNPQWSSNYAAIEESEQACAPAVDMSEKSRQRLPSHLQRVR